MNIKNLLKKYWVVIALILIIGTSFYVRNLDYRWPYLRNVDSYDFYRFIDDAAHGGIKLNDTLILAPNGYIRSQELFPYQYLSAYSYLLTKLFIPDLQLWTFLIYFPALLASLVAIPTYFIGKYLYNKKAGVIAALFIVFDISFVSRSLAGDPDNDCIVLLVALITIALFLLTYKHVDQAKKIDKRCILYTALTGISLGIFNQTWVGYWYVVWIIIGFIVLKILVDFLKTKNLIHSVKQHKNIVVSFAVSIIILIVFFQIPFYGFGRATYTFTGPIEFQSIKSEDTEFPNVYVSVAELQSSGSIKDIIQRTSPVDFNQNPLAILISPFFMMIYCLIYLGYSYAKKKEHLDTLIFLGIWFIGPLLATIVAVRFSTLFAAPIAIGTAIILVKLFEFGEKSEI